VADLMFTTDALIDGAVQWFGSMPHWPEETPAVVARRNWHAKFDCAAHYGVQAVLLMLVAANEGEWPPVSPRRFAKGLRDPRAAAQITRYAKEVVVGELRRER